MIHVKPLRARIYNCRLALCAVWSSECHDQAMPTGPILSRFQPAGASVEPLTSFVGSLPATPGSTIALPSYPFRERVVAEIRVEGQIDVTSVDHSTFQINDPVGARGVTNRNGIGNCAVGVSLSYGGGGFGTGSCGPARWDTSSLWIDTTYVGGTWTSGPLNGQPLVGVAKRGSKIDEPSFSPCYDFDPANPCHDYWGAQTIRLTPLASQLVLIPSDTAVAAGYLNFTATANPAWFGSDQVPRYVLAWKWIPDGGTAVSRCSPGSSACQIHVPVNGLVVVTARVNGVVQVDSTRVTVGPQLRILPTENRMLFSIHQTKGTKVVRHIDRTQLVTISVIGTNGQPIPNQAVTLSLAAQEGTAGHIHTGGKPAGQLSATSINTGPTGVDSVTYTAPRVSGPVLIKGVSGSLQASAEVKVGLFTLTLLPASNTYDLTGAIPGKHIENHYATSEHIQKLTEFARWFLSWYGQPPQFNDSSLPLGGLYDYQATWEQPHAAHGEGRATDFYTGNLEPIATWIAGDKWQKLTGMTPGDETLTGNHFHITTSR